ncbi:MAG: HAMP domain-containing sensor histidine kinase [Oscillospiraceae bacterium]|nr:HAMP domain-containing sensor histidine kinase [Oscillospiraceae bacterium]
MKQFKNKQLESKRSLQFHIWLNLIFFVVCTALLLWIFQIAFLQNFYEKMRTHTIQETAHEMSDSFRKTDATDSDELNKLMQKYDSFALDNDFSYIVVDSQIAYLIHSNDDNVIDTTFSPKVRSIMARNASLKNGYYETSQPGPMTGSEAVLICTSLYDSSDRVIGYLMISSIITPVNSTIHILKQNTYIIIAILVIITLILSVFISQSIANPIVKITKSADKLAKGEYNIKFEGGRFSETRKLAKSLTYASSEISKLDELQRDLIANVSHDLRTPLTMIKAYAEMIRDLSGPVKEKREAHLGVIIKETDRLASLVSDMLDLSKLEKGKQTLNISTFDINSKLVDIVERYKGLSGAGGYTINFTADTPVYVKCDVVKIEQVIYNLLNNAINYTGEDKQVYIEQILEEKYVKIIITDSGNGIDEENIHQIFDKYYRCEKTKREVIGSGLGLSIVRAVLQKHNFPFGVQSKLGVGTSFWFKISRDSETICPDNS